MKKGNKVVYGIYRNRDEIELAVDTLRNSKFRNDDISVLMPRMGDTESFAHEKSTKAPEGAAVGGSAGALIGGTLGWLVGIGAGTIAPPLGVSIIAGPLVTALAGAGMGGTLGGLAGALIGLGFPEYEAKRYEGYIIDGGILLSVHVDDDAWMSKAKQVLTETNAQHIASSHEAPRHKTLQDSDDYPPYVAI